MSDYTSLAQVLEKRKSKANTDRNEKVINLYRTGEYSYFNLSKIFNVTPQRIGQIIKDAIKKEKNNLPNE